MASEFCPDMANEKYPVLATKNSQSENFRGLELADLLLEAVCPRFNTEYPLNINLINQSTFPQYFKELWN